MLPASDRSRPRWRFQARPRRSGAIATGKGISAWFVPSTSDERVGGAAVASFGPGMESVATIKLIAMEPEPKSKAWAALTDALGFSGATPGGVVKQPRACRRWVASSKVLAWRTTRSCSFAWTGHPGLAHLFPMPMGGQVLLSIRFSCTAIRRRRRLARSAVVGARGRISSSRRSDSPIRGLFAKRKTDGERLAIIAAFRDVCSILAGLVLALVLVLAVELRAPGRRKSTAVSSVQ